MKKITISVAMLLCAVVFNANATDTLSVNSSTSEFPALLLKKSGGGGGDGVKGKLIITAGIGLNLLRTNLEVRYIASGLYSNFFGTTPTWKQTPMFNVAADYGLMKRLSVGVAFGYQKAVGTYSDDYYSFQDTWTRIHLAARGDYYIIAHDNLSLYTGVKIGYNIYSVKSTIDNSVYPNYVSDLDVHPLVVSAQVHFGFSYFFANVVGINAEIGLGLGGPYIFAAGVTFKI